MKSDHPTLSRSAITGLYVFGTSLFFWPIADLVSNALPIQLGNFHWRYGFGGLLAAYMSTPVLALVLLMAVAYGLRHPRTLRVLSVFEIIMSVGLLVVIVVFALDMLQVRAARPEAARPSVLAGGIIAMAKHFTSAVVLVLLGIGGWRTAGRWKVREARPSEAGRAGIVMKQKGADDVPDTSVGASGHARK